MSFQVLDVAADNDSLTLPEAGKAFVIVNSYWQVSRPQLEEWANAATGSTHQELTIYPLGEAGLAAWQSLPPRIALLATRPGNSAAIVGRTGGASTSFSLFWQKATEIEESRFDVKSGIAAPTGPGPEPPLLAPGGGTAPRWLIERIGANELLGDRVTSRDDVIALRAGLLQLHDELDLSHQQSQAIEGEGRNRAGDYWHAIMHRREPDYGNAKYWFRRVGTHPIMRTLGEHAARILEQARSNESARWSTRLKSRGWDPLAFVDLCEECSSDENSSLANVAREIQWMEMILLLGATYRDATA